MIQRPQGAILMNAGERLAEAEQGRAQVLADRLLQRGQDLVELDRIGGLADRDRPAVGEVRRRGRARMDVDEELQR